MADAARWMRCRRGAARTVPRGGGPQQRCWFAPVSRVAPSPPRIVSDFSERNWTFPKKSSCLIASRHVQIRSCAGLPSKFFGTNRDPAPSRPQVGVGRGSPTEQASMSSKSFATYAGRAQAVRSVRAATRRAARNQVRCTSRELERMGEARVFGGEEFHDALLTASASALAPPTSPISLRPRPSHTHTHTHSRSLARDLAFRSS